MKEYYEVKQNICEQLKSEIKKLEKTVGKLEALNEKDTRFFNVNKIVNDILWHEHDIHTTITNEKYDNGLIKLLKELYKVSY